MRSFIEIVPDGDGYRFIRNMNDYNMCGVKADNIPGWYEAQQYRCFRSSNSAVVAHETLRVTQPQVQHPHYGGQSSDLHPVRQILRKFQGNADYEQFAQFYKQPISTTVTVIGTEGIEDPNLQPLDRYRECGGQHLHRRTSPIWRAPPTPAPPEITARQRMP